jgi:hypothetical protein
VKRTRLALTADIDTLLAEDDFGIVGFAHVVFDSDPTWGALLDNLHVAQRRTRQGVGSAGKPQGRPLPRPILRPAYGLPPT